MNPPLLILIAGLPGTGKTTFADALARKVNAVHLNSDKVRTELGRSGQYDMNTKKAVYEALLALTRDALLDGRLVVVDATFFRKKLRKPFIDLAGECKSPVCWMEIRAEEPVIRQRVARKRAYSEADFEVYQKIKATCEPLEMDRLILWSDQMSPEEMAEKAKAYIDKKQPQTR